MDGEWAKEPHLVKRSNGSRERLKELLLSSIDERASGLKQAALLFSGGVDSSLLALLLKDKIDLHCYCAGTKESHDWSLSEKSAETLGVGLTRVEFDIESVREELPKVVKAVGTNVMKTGVAFPLWMCCKEIKQENVFFGMGTEELFAGYQRHRDLLPDYRAIDEECWNGAVNSWDRDISRDITVCNAFSKEPLFPFLDKEFVEEALAIPSEQKIDEQNNKLILREIAVELGLPKEIAFHAKKAAQYGSHSDKLIRKLAKEKGMRVQDYLRAVGN